MITSEAGLADYFEKVVAEGVEPKTAANWVMSDVMTSYNETGAFPVAPARLAGLVASGARRGRESSGGQAGLSGAGAVSDGRPEGRGRTTRAWCR